MCFVITLLLSSSCVIQASLPRGAEETIGRITLNDVQSSAPLLRTFLVETPANDLPRYRFVNRGRTEVMTLLQHPGARRFNISEVRVKSFRAADDSLPVFPDSPIVFRTGRGVRLGATKEDVMTRLGAPTEESEEELRYRLTAETARAWLKLHNYPEYRAVYVFRQDRLVEFEFGFPYP